MFNIQNSLKLLIKSELNSRFHEPKRHKAVQLQLRKAKKKKKRAHKATSPKLEE